MVLKMLFVGIFKCEKFVCKGLKSLFFKVGKVC